MQIVEYKT